MVALRQPHNRIMLTTPQQIQLNPLQPGEGLVGPWPLKTKGCSQSQLPLGFCLIVVKCTLYKIGHYEYLVQWH